MSVNSAGEKKNCPLIRDVRLLECPLIGENTVYRTGMYKAGHPRIFLVIEKFYKR